MSWGSALGEIRTDTVLRINERGEWTELGGNREGILGTHRKTAKVVGAR